MATASVKTICATCQKEKITYPCHGCSQHFCLTDLSEHRKNLGQQLDHIEADHDELRQSLNDQRTDPTKHPSIEEINQWEKDCIRKIQETAERYRNDFISYSSGLLHEIEKKLNDLAEGIKEMHHENEFNEIDLTHLKQRLQELREELLRPSDVSIKQQSTSFINNISVRIPFHKDTQWKQFGTTIAGGNGKGDRLDQLCGPCGICLDDNDQTIYIVDCENARIVGWTLNATAGRVVAGGNGPGNQTNQLNNPKNVVIDREDNSLIIADAGNRRVMRWSRETTPHGQIIISDIDCCGLILHRDGSLYVSDWKKNEVRRWKKGETNGTIVAGGNGKDNHLNQLCLPTRIFVDDDHALYVSDSDNHRVMKWVKDGKEGIVVAGGNGQGDGPTQFSHPRGVIVDRFGQIYVADAGNDRVMRWCAGATEGMVVIGGNGEGEEANQLHKPVDLSFDREGNLYVADWKNERIQKFAID